MKKFYLFYFLILISACLQAQDDNRITFTVSVPNEKDSVYIVGNQPSLGNWDPGAVLMERSSRLERSITLSVKLPAEFKFTKGNWDSEGYTGKKWDTKNLLIENPIKESRHLILGWYDEGRFFFDEEYKSFNRGNYNIEVPEVQELINLIFALTPTGMADTNLVNHEGSYYKKVMQEFKKYSSDRLVLQMDKLLKDGKYNPLKMDACGFYFEGPRIKKDKAYEYLGWYGPNHIEPFILELERFAEETNFRKFYKQQTSYYNSLISLMEEQTPVKDQWEWLEKNFKSRYDHYRISFSPLTGGSHATNNYVQSDFKQSMMFIRGPFESPDYDKAVTEGLMTVIIFTEIDHNYVNPVSDKYMKNIAEGLKNLPAWASEDALKYYNSEYAVFNEYMTWGVYFLYAQEKFEEKDFEVIKSLIEPRMVERRGFKKFKEFNNKLSELYKNKQKNQTIEDLYPAILEWAKSA